MADKFERFTKRARQSLSVAQEEARRLNHSYIGTEHLLLGLMREQEGIAARVLTDLGLTVAQVRRAVERTIGRLKEHRRIATRYDKLAASFRAFIILGCIRIWAQKLL